jgi:hypothetical protein
MRKIDESSPRHHEYLPHRRYESRDVSYLEPETQYSLLVELWPTAVVVSPGGKLVLEVNTGDSQGCGIFLHNEPTDRSEKEFAGVNRLHVGPGLENWMSLPVV